MTMASGGPISLISCRPLVMFIPTPLANYWFLPCMRMYQKEGETFVDKYTELLTAGGSLSPYEMMKPFGIDLDSPTFWMSGLTVIEEMLVKVE